MADRFPCFLSSFLLIVFLMIGRVVSAQEFNCVVELNTESVEGTNRNVFDELKQEMETYINDFRWTDNQFSPKERIDCRIFLTVKDYSGGRISGDLQVQLSRPVFNSSYTTTLFNFKDTEVEFDFREGDHLNHIENSWDGNLKGLLDFYSLLLLAIDYDSFSLFGGQEYYDRAAKIVQLAQSGGDKGWRLFDNNRNRSAVINAFTDRNTSGIRELLYRYHRKGLDQMSTSMAKGRSEITDAIKIMAEIHKVSPMSVALPIFRDAKLDELTDIYSQAPQSEKKEVHSLLREIYPMDGERLDRILETEKP